MSKKYRAVGGVFDGLTRFADSVTGLLTSGSKVVDRGTAAVEGIYTAGGVIPIILEDPGLPLLTREIVRLHTVEQRYPSTGPAGTPGKGIGLVRIVPIVKGYTWYRENPTMGLLAGLGIVAIPFLLGYVAGKGKRNV